MTDGDRAAIDVDDVRVPAEILVDGAALCGEGFVGFDKVKLIDRPAGLLERLARCRDGPGVPMMLGSTPAVA